MPTNDVNKIAVIGAGFSGTLVAVQLLRQAACPLTVYLIEPNLRQFGRGLAYSTDQDCHLLNAPAANMSAFPGDPEHFLRWARTREKSLLNAPWVTEVSGGTFLPRRAYGDYLFELLDKTERSAAAGVRLEKKFVQAVDLRPGARSLTIGLRDGEQLKVQKAVLAVGNFPPRDPAVGSPDFYQSSRYYGNPWRPEALHSVLKTESCLLIGSGLTMVDWSVALDKAGYMGAIHVISRRGLWPLAHSPATPVSFRIDPDAAAPSVRRWLHELRRYIRVSACDWRAVVDALRPHTPALWASLPPAERRRFLRHARIYWDCHRHRLAPVVAERLDELLASGQLQRHTGRICEYRQTANAVDVIIRRRGQTGRHALRVDAVVNCSGSDSNYQDLESPLVGGLLEQQLIHPDPLALGLDVEANGALVHRDGTVSDCLFTLGPPQKGAFWETIAVPEIRVQAKQLAKTLLSSLC